VTEGAQWEETGGFRIAQGAMYNNNVTMNALSDDIWNILTPKLEEIPEVRKDPRMLLPETRKAVNEKVLSNWNNFKEIQSQAMRDAEDLVATNQDRPQLVDGDILDVVDNRRAGLKWPETSEERVREVYYQHFFYLKLEEAKGEVGIVADKRMPLKGWWGDVRGLNYKWDEITDQLDAEFEKEFGKPITEAILPFKDVTTDYSQEQVSKEVIAERIGHVTDFRYAGDHPANAHAIKMGYWEDVKVERMSNDQISKASNVKKVINPQIDDVFMDTVFGDETELQPELRKIALEQRLKLSSKQAHEKVVVGLMRTALIDGTLQGGSAGMAYMTDNPAEGCIAAIFDTLRDESNCLWNHAEGDFCDE